MKNITFDEMFDYIIENVSGDYNLYKYLLSFVSNMVDNSLYCALFSWSEGEVFQIEINSNSNELTTYNIREWGNNSLCLKSDLCDYAVDSISGIMFTRD